MSYRNTFVTEFIYHGSDDGNQALTEVFERWAGTGLKSKPDERGYGFYAGIFKGLYSTEYENDLHQIVPELEKATKVAFRLTVLPELGPSLTYDIEPREVIPTS